MSTAPLKADIAAADRLLKAAVRRAVEVMARAHMNILRDASGNVLSQYLEYDRAYVEETLTSAGKAADLLLTGGAS